MEEKYVKTISWQAPEYEHTPKNNDWLWSIGLIALAGMIITIFLKNYLFAVFILVAGGSLIIISVREPREINFEINEEGITAGGVLYSKKKMKGFTIHPKNDFSILLLETDRHFMPVIMIPVPKYEANDIRLSLLALTEEKEIPLSNSMLFMEKIGF